MPSNAPSASTMSMTTRTASIVAAVLFCSSPTTVMRPGSCLALVESNAMPLLGPSAGAVPA